jgi:hypothetical protein
MNLLHHNPVKAKELEEKIEKWRTNVLNRPFKNSGTDR